MTEKNISRQEHEQYCQKMLKRAKLTIKAFAMDQDGTVNGGNDVQYKKANVADLLLKIARKNKYPAIITASGASALKSFSALEALYTQDSVRTPIFIGIGNGLALYRFDKNGKTEIYNNKLTLEEVKAIIKIWEQIYSSLNIDESNLQPKGLETFKDFMNTDWKEYTPKEYADLHRQYNGRCFTEEIKVTVVFPAWEESKQRDLVKQFQIALNCKLGQNKYLASRGDDTFLHITHNFDIDPKLFALQEIMNYLKLGREDVVAFGDMPFDNDRGLLIDSGLPYSFTNKSFNKKDLETPPFILPGTLKSQVGSVHQAIDYLLS